MDNPTTAAPPPADLRLQRSSRDTATVTARLTTWLATVLPPGADPSVVVHGAADAERDVLRDRAPRRHLGRRPRGGHPGRQVRRPGSAGRAGRAGVPDVRPAAPVRRDPAGRRAHGRARPDRALDRADR